MEFEWDSSNETREELAELIENNLEEFEYACASHYVADYPYSRANDLPIDIVMAWTDDSLLALCSILRGGDTSLFLFQNVNGDLYKDPREISFAKFVNSIAGPLSMARNMAGVINRLNIADISRAQRLISCMENLIKLIIFDNMNAYWTSIEPAAALSSRWDMYERVSETIEEDPDAPTPRARFAPAALKDAQKDASSREGDAADDLAFEDAGLLEIGNRKLKAPQGSPLSKRERDVLGALVEGKTNSDISQLLSVKVSTVKSYISRIFDKYNVNSRAELLAKIL